MSVVREYSEKQISSALQLLEEYNATSNEEVLHQLRVSLKKIKAVLDYLRTLHPKKIKSTRKKLQFVFHAAGSLREAQLRLKWLTEKKLLLLIRHSSFDQKIKEEKELFVTHKHDYLKKQKSVSDEIDKCLKKVDEEDLLRYALKLKAKLQEQLPVFSKENWHALRKLIKQLLYAYHWLTDQDKLKVLTVTAFKKLDMLQENIGIWHDAVDLQQWLTDGQFFLSKDKSVKQQFNKAFALVQKDIEVKEKVVIKQLQAIIKPVIQK